MKRTILFYLVALFPIFCSAQSLNVSLLGTWDGASVDYNDIWGYVDNQGNEYAIIGSLTKIHVVNVTNPSVVATKANSRWPKRLA